MKRNVRIIIPLVVFLVSVLAGYCQTYLHNRSIERLVNEAGNRGEPIVAVFMETQPVWVLPFYQLQLRLYNIQGEFVRIAVDEDFYRTDELYFNDDGTLFIQNHIYTYFDRFLLSIKLIDNKPQGIWIHVSVAIDPGDTFIGSGNVAKTNNIVGVYEDRIQVFNPDGEIILTHEFINPFPSVTDASEQFHKITFALTHDMSKLIVIGYKQRENVGKSLIYNLETGEWDNLGDPATEFYIIEPDMGGRFISCMYKDSSGILEPAYIDLDTDGKLSSPLAGSIMPDIWTNWAALIDTFGITPIIRMYDIKNDWEEHTINLPGTAFGASDFILSLAIYEPPLNGLDGMYENFE